MSRTSEDPAAAGCPSGPADRGTGGVGEAVAKLAGRLDIGYPGDLVVAFRIGDATAIELARQPFPAIDGDLDRIRRPTLQTDMHPAELGIDQVPVEMQALARTAHHLQPFGFPVAGHGERPARLQGRERAALDHPVILGNPETPWRCPWRGYGRRSGRRAAGRWRRPTPWRGLSGAPSRLRRTRPRP